MIPEDVHVTLYDGFRFYSGTGDMFLGISVAGYFWAQKNRIGIRAPKYLGHELIGLIMCKANDVTDEREDECMDAICYASPISMNSGLCKRHREIVEDKLAGARVGLDVLIFPDSDPQKLKGEFGKMLGDFREKTGIDAYLDKTTVIRRKIRNGSWLIRREGIECILPPVDIDDVYKYKPTRIYSMDKIPSWDRERHEKVVEMHRARMRKQLLRK